MGDTSSSTNWPSSDTSGGWYETSPVPRTKKAKKKSQEIVDIVAEMKKIADEQEEDRIKNLPKFDPTELDI